MQTVIDFDCDFVVFFRFILHCVCISLTTSMFTLNCGLSIFQ